jgi:uncharacterized membrane protein
MAVIERSTQVDLPVRTVYNQWTQFEEFPAFMEGVDQVRQLDDTHLHWVAEIAGVRREWDAEIVEQVPDRRIAWTAQEGLINRGVVTFEGMNGTTMVEVTMEFEPENFPEKVGEVLGIVESRIKGDLDRFKEFIEDRQSETGAWRGTVGRDIPEA